ncbi:MAG: hypothetical protein PHT19_13735 [Methylococcus sp.]|nr:hypothetical protein [Methylococcus sp.]
MKIFHDLLSSIALAAVSLVSINMDIIDEKLREANKSQTLIEVYNNGGNPSKKSEPA